jgi:hypothetical protein
MNTVADEFTDDKKDTVIIRTTLYDLIEAINSEVSPDEEELVVATVLHLLRSGRIRFVRNPEYYN